MVLVWVLGGGILTFDFASSNFSVGFFSLEDISGCSSLLGFPLSVGLPPSCSLPLSLGVLSGYFVVSCDYCMWYIPSPTYSMMET